jgi:hypothetical protein
MEARTAVRNPESGTRNSTQCAMRKRDADAEASGRFDPMRSTEEEFGIRGGEASGELAGRIREGARPREAALFRRSASRLASQLYSHLISRLQIRIPLPHSASRRISLLESSPESRIQSGSPFRIRSMVLNTSIPIARTSISSRPSGSARASSDRTDRITLS